MRKQLIIVNKVFALALFILAFVYARADVEEIIEKRKVETRSYPLTSSDKISLANEYGEMKLITWDKQEISIIITMISKARTENRAEELMNGIVIESSKNSIGVTCFTQFKNNSDPNHGVVQDEEYTINYEVYLPGSNPLWVQNKFGLLVVPDYNGPAEIKSDHGILKTGKIANAKEVSVAFGRGEIFHVHSGHITIRYSKAEINKLSGYITATFEFADSIRISMDNDIKSMSIRNFYSTLYLDLAGSFSATFRINSQLDSVIAVGGLKLKEETVQGVTNKKYDITYRRYTVTSGAGERNIDIDSKFGKVIVGHYYSYRKSTTTTTTTEKSKFNQ